MTKPHPSTRAAGRSDAPAGLVLRALDRARDLTRLVEVGNASSAADGPAYVSTLAEYEAVLDRPVGFDPALDVVVGELDGTVMASGTVWLAIRDGEPVFGIECSVDPAVRRRGVGRALLHWLERRSRERAAAELPGQQAQLSTWQQETNTDALALLEQAGYRPVRYFFDMVRPTLEDLPDLPLPDGLELRPVEPSQHRKLYDADVEAFLDHWGSREGSDEQFEQRHADPEIDPSLWSAAWDGDEVAGLVSAYVYPAENAAHGIARGWLQRVSVRRPWRRRGVASALMVDAMRTLRDRGLTSAALDVDADNPTGALGVYERLGFAVTKRSIVLRKPLDPA